MKAAIEFKAELRENSGKSSTRALRNNGQIPAVIYSAGKDAVSVSLEEKIITQAYNKGGFLSKIVSINTGKETFHALPKDLQMHPVTDRIQHADFLKVDAKTVIRVNVVVKFLNADKCVGIKRGGSLNVVRHTIELWSKPADIPDCIEVDIAEADIGHSIHLAHIELPENVKPTIERDFTIATIAGRLKQEEEEEATAEAVEGEEVEGEETTEEDSKK